MDGCERCRERLREVVEISRALPGRGRGRGTAPADRSGAGRATPGDGCPGDETLAAYADGSLEPRRAGRVEAHLARCEACLAEVADLIALSAAQERDAPDRSVQRVLARLDEERRTAVVRLAERSIELIRGFARARPSEAGAMPAGAPTPAYATARAARAPVRVGWAGEGPLEVECEIRPVLEGATLTGRVTSGAAPALATSVTLVTPAETWGPESPDRRGRFGPWRLGPGRNRLVLAGSDNGAGSIELWIEVRGGDPSSPRGGEGSERST